MRTGRGDSCQSASSWGKDRRSDEKSLGCAGFNLVQNNGEAAGQTVMHFHMHVIPRYEGGPSIVGWTPGTASGDELAQLAQRIKDSL